MSVIVPSITIIPNSTEVSYVYGIDTPKVALKSPEKTFDTIKNGENLATTTIFIPSPLLKRICYCENSSERHFNENGEVIKHYNDNGTIDYGRCQISEQNIPLAKSMELDVVGSEEDNMKFAQRLLDTRGTGQFYGYDSKENNCVWEK